MTQVRSFFSELKRRNVLRAGVLYIGVTWALSQGAAQLAPVFEVPNWAVRGFVVAGAIGFPFWILLAWFYEWTPQGFRRERDVIADESIAPIGSALVQPKTVTSPSGSIESAAMVVADKGRVDTTDAERRGATLAVLPFVNLDNDPAQDYFVAGMTEEVIAALTHIRSLLVIASSANPGPDAGHAAPLTVARQHGVHYVLEGSVRRVGSRVRIAVKLTDAAGGGHVWADRFEDTLEDAFALQDHVAISVAGMIEPNVNAAELRRAARIPLANAGCYDLYLRAMYLRTTLRKDAVYEALDLLDQGLRLDPHFAPALAQAAGCHSQIVFNHWADDVERHRKLGLDHAEHALRVGGDDAAVLAQVANALMDLESAGIDRAMELALRAVSLNPGCAFAWFISGVLKLIHGDGEAAVDHMRRAMRLDTMSPLHGVARAHLAAGLLVQERFGEALAEMRAAGKLSARFQLLKACLASNLGQVQEAREDLRHYEQLTSTPAETMASGMTRQESLRNWMLAGLAQIRAGSNCPEVRS